MKVCLNDDNMWILLNWLRPCVSIDRLLRDSCTSTPFWPSFIYISYIACFVAFNC